MKKEYFGLEVEIKMFTCENVLDGGVSGFWGGEDNFDDLMNALEIGGA